MLLFFIGINPAFNENINPITTDFYYNNVSGGSKEVMNKYFWKFEDISSKLGFEWSHIDLLFIRELEQSKINEIITTNEGAQFIYHQLIITKKIIEKAKPKVIVVNNSLARQLLGFHQNDAGTEGVWMGYKFEFDDIIGTPKIINESSLANVPVFFTNMLTGQRALDIGSYERLIWHIKFALERIS